MITGPKPLLPIVTTELCVYGCGNVARFRNKSNKLMCNEFSSRCIANKKKNSNGLKQAYNNGTKKPQKTVYDDLPEETKKRMIWNKGNYNADFSLFGKGSHKLVLIKERGHVCESCGNSKWMGKDIPIQLEHIDGNNNNNIKENLKLLCPNCHAQTDTYCGKNIPKKSEKDCVSDDEFKRALKETKNIRQALIKLCLTPKGAHYARAYRLMYE
jgi:hypothetical protein